MALAEQKARRANRINLQIPVRIEAQQTENALWREMTHLMSVSPLGASFYLKHKFPVGQLIHLMMPLPSTLRCYDLWEQTYSVWAIIRHCNSLSVVDASAYHVGVAFIGKQPPSSYRENPLRLYKISGGQGESMWEVAEDDRPFYKEKQPRYSIPVDVSLAVLDNAGNIVAQERTVTENISRCGAAVFSVLDVSVGSRVQLINEHENFSVFAFVRNRRLGKDNLPRLHLEFIDAQFPLTGIE